MKPGTSPFNPTDGRKYQPQPSFRRKGVRIATLFVYLIMALLVTTCTTIIIVNIQASKNQSVQPLKNQPKPNEKP